MDRVKLEDKILEAITDVLETSGDIENSLSTSDDSSKSLESSVEQRCPSVASGMSKYHSVFEEARAAGLAARLELMKKRNALQNHIREQEMKLAEMNLEMEIEQARAQRAAFSKYDRVQKPAPTTPKNERNERQTSTAMSFMAEHTDSNHDYRTTKRHTQDTKECLELVRRINLPKMTMDNFDGDLMKYGSFIRQFESNIASKTDNEEEKLNYLEQMTTGKPNLIVKTCLHLPPGDGYLEARRLLDKRYGDSSKVAASLVSQILAWPFVHPNDVNGLDEFSIFLRGCLNSLKSIPLGMSEVDARTIRQILSRLPPDFTEKWRNAADLIESNDNRNASFEDFVLFIERLARVAGNPWYGKQMFPDSQSSTFPQVKTMAGSTYPSVSPCSYCKQSHDTSECTVFAEIPLHERQRFVMKAGLCYGCLKKGHISAACPERKTCSVCNGRHPSSLHRKDNDKHESVVSLHASPTLVPVHGSKLHVVPLLVTLGGKTVKTNAFLDSGSTHSFCSHSLLKELRCRPDEAITMNLTTVQNQARLPSHVVRDVLIKDLSNTFCLSLPPLLTLEHISVSRDDFQTSRNMYQYLRERGVYIAEVEGDVGLLLGTNAALAMEPLEVVNSKDGGPYAIRTRFGWIISGGENLGNPSVNSMWVTKEWAKVKGTLATEERGPSVEDRLWCAHVDASCTRTEDGNFQIALPLREDNLTLPCNKMMALKRLEALKKKCLHNRKFFIDYSNQMNEILSKGFAEKVPVQDRPLKGRVWYLPHHGVYHPRKPGKVRIVFDCAAKCQGISLNDELLQGPDLTNSLFDVLIRFREERVAIMGDIESMFMMVFVPEEDRNLFRFLWWPSHDLNAEPQEYRMTRHIFGATSSPSCANYALRRTALDYGHHFSTDAPQALLDNFYVDDCLKSVATEDEGIRRYQI